MPGFNLPPDWGSLVKNTEGDTPQTLVGPTADGPLSLHNVDAPSDDSAKIPRGITADHGGRGYVHGKNVTSDGMHPDLDVRSIPTMQADLPQNEKEWSSGTKGTNWMAGGSYPTTGQVPKVPSGSNKRPYRPQGR